MLALTALGLGGSGCITVNIGGQSSARPNHGASHMYYATGPSHQQARPNGHRPSESRPSPGKGSSKGKGKGSSKGKSPSTGNGPSYPLPATNHARPRPNGGTKPKGTVETHGGSSAAKRPTTQAPRMPSGRDVGARARRAARTSSR